MTADWDDGFGNHDDPFGVSNDVFGKNVEDVDVWRANDSFDGVKEWNDFNGDGDSDGEDNVARRSSSSKATRSRSSKESTGAKKRQGKRSPKSSSISSPSSSLSDAKPPKSKSKVPKRDSASAAGKTTRKSTSSKSKKPAQEKAKPLVDAEDDPFAIGDFNCSSPSDKKSTVNGGFADFADFGSPSLSSSKMMMNKVPRSPVTMQPKTQQNKRGPPMSPFSSTNSSASPRRATHSAAFTDDALASSYHSARSSAMGASSSRRKSNGALVRRRDGTVSRARASEASSRHQKSESRRGAIRDSLFDAIGGSEEPDISLSSFLRQDSQTSLGSVGDNGSVRSAPAAPHSHRHHHGAPPTPASSSGIKSRRWNKKMMLPPATRDTPTKKKEAVTLDIAQLAQAGYIEVKDGKMRLVIDMET
jgi:hypothetical protein